MSLPVRSAAVFSLASALLALLLTPGCSQQGEGERCESINGDSDCDDGLKCVSKNDLLSKLTDRCCNPDQTTFTDSRCQPDTGSGGSGGSAGSAGSASQPDAGAAGHAAGGEPTSGTGGVPATPEAGAGGQLSSNGGVPAMPEAGAPNGGMVSLPTAGQGGAD